MSEYIVDVNDSSEMYAVEMGRYEELREVIRCKDCKFHTNGMCLINYARNGMYIHCGNEEFCCWAERKEE